MTEATNTYLLTIPFYFIFINFYWSRVALQPCVSFFCTERRISYTCTYIPFLLDFLPFDGYLILESTGMTWPPTTLTHTSGLDRHLAHAPSCWQHNQWYLQTLDFLLSCQVWRAVSPSKMALPIHPCYWFESIMSNMKSLIHLLSPAIAACRQKAWSECLLFCLRDKRLCMEVPQMAREVQWSDCGEIDL